MEKISNCKWAKCEFRLVVVVFVLAGKNMEAD